MKSETHSTVGAFFYADISDVAHASLEGLLRRATVVRSEDGSNGHVRFSREHQFGSVAVLYWGLHRPMEALMSLMGWEHDRLGTVYEQGVDRLTALGERLDELGRDG